jgi:hypothetical protein
MARANCGRALLKAGMERRQNNKRITNKYNMKDDVMRCTRYVDISPTPHHIVQYSTSHQSSPVGRCAPAHLSRIAWGEPRTSPSAMRYTDNTSRVAILLLGVSSIPRFQ